METIAELRARIAELTQERDMLRARLEPLRARIRALSDEVVKLRPLAEQQPAPEQERDPKRIVAAAQALAREIISQAKKDARAEAKRIIREAREREQAKKQAKREAERAKKEAARLEPEQLEAMRPRRVNFTYRNYEYEVTTRTVDVECAYDGPGGYYFRGYCHLRQERRTFRLDRVIGDLTNVDTGEVLSWMDFARRWELVP